MSVFLCASFMIIGVVGMINPRFGFWGLFGLGAMWLIGQQNGLPL